MPPRQRGDRRREWPLSRNGTGSYAKHSGQAVSRSGGRSNEVKDLLGWVVAAVVRAPTAREVKSCTAHPDGCGGERAARGAQRRQVESVCRQHEARRVPGHVARVPQDDRVQHQPERTELVLLALAIRLAELATAAVEHGASQAMAT